MLKIDACKGRRAKRGPAFTVLFFYLEHLQRQGKTDNTLACLRGAVNGGAEKRKGSYTS
jgi:hypothetical protein